MLTTTPVQEAQMQDTPAGRVPEGDGWFIVNVADGRAIDSPDFGKACVFEGPDHRFEEFGINVHVLEPGQPNCRYHKENVHEVFLLISGEAIAIVEGVEHPLRKGDFFSAAPGTAHLLVGAGNGPCSILMVGTRPQGGEELLYPANETAAKYGGSAEVDTPSPEEAYANTQPRELKPLGMIPW
jgi:uncharacterized cupin superfamily protein